MRKFIQFMNRDDVAQVVCLTMIGLIIGGMMIFSCIRDEAGLGMVRQPAPLELTECASCSP